MKVFISADIEGVTGVTHWDETDMGKAGYEAAREQMTAEVAAACEGALAAGATEVWVKDSHDSGRNLLAGRLPQAVRLIRGWSGHPFMMVQQLDETFQAAMLVGYHSGVGMGRSPLEHTFSGSLTGLKLNGRLMSEFAFDAYTAAHVGVPLVLVSGDRGLCEEVAQWNPQITTVAVKEGVGNSTVNLHPALAVDRIRAGAAQALSGDVAQCRLALPAHFTLELRYRQPTQAYRVGFFPGARQTDPNTVQFDTDHYFEVLRFLLFAI